MALRTRVLYVAAAGRSGSTLLDRIVGQLPGYVSTGELRVLPNAGIRENRLCGCGKPFHGCPFWTDVGRVAYGGWDAVDPMALHAAGEVGYVAAVGDLLRGRLPRAAGQDLLVRLYSAISEVAGGATVIDSSKGPRYGAVLAAVPEFDVRIAHLVRDSRGVAFSWGKHVTRPDVPDRSVEMMRMPPWQAAGRWISQNAMLELLGRRATLARTRYEDLLASPRREIGRIMSGLGWGIDPAALGYVTGSSVDLAVDHTVMGNPMRMQHGPIELRLDDAWRDGMAFPSRAMVTTMTWPLLLRYGYDLAGTSTAPRMETPEGMNQGSEV
jgi:hypothetical protein